MRAPCRPEGTQAFSLRPFGSAPAPLGLHLGGEVGRRGDRLAITYQLKGPLASVVLPTPSTTGAPHRLDGLWKHTCFELFLAAEGLEPYWEVNLAPNGDWNLYRLDGYRRGLAPMGDRDALPFAVKDSEESLVLNLWLELPRELALACRQRALQLGITAVMEHPQGDLTYWALTHGGEEADFHRREDFLLQLAPP
ncbi:MAG: DOMON-like domain-containing protein [Cyanobacteriota bacterium]|nr:DOMON-like domain-containing protein [Cyanobacteriota bacterium]